jgi:hypothetical protein
VQPDGQRAPFILQGLHRHTQAACCSQSAASINGGTVVKASDVPQSERRTTSAYNVMVRSIRWQILNFPVRPSANGV